MTETIYDPALHGEDDERRNRVREWLESNGIDTRHVSVDWPIEVSDENVIHWLGFVTDENGVRQYNEETGPIMSEMSKVVTVPWQEALPETDPSPTEDVSTTPEPDPIPMEPDPVEPDPDAEGATEGG